SFRVYKQLVQALATTQHAPFNFTVDQVGKIIFSVVSVYAFIRIADNYGSIVIIGRIVVFTVVGRLRIAIEEVRFDVGVDKLLGESIGCVGEERDVADG